MEIYRTLPVYHVIYPDYTSDAPNAIAPNISRFLSRPLQGPGNVSVEWADELDHSQGVVITIGDNDPVTVTEVAFTVDPFSGRVIPCNNGADNGLFVTIGTETPSVDWH